MIRLTALIAGILVSLVFWHECGEDLGVFCYRIGLGAFTSLRSRALVPVPASQKLVSGNHSACSNRSSTFSTRFIAQRDFES